MKEKESYLIVRDIQRYIDEHLTQEITLSILAEHVHYSPWYCARVFKDLTGKTIFEYIRLLRLTAAARVLKAKDVPVFDVAFDFYFQSQEGFTRAFTKAFGISPKQYSIKKPPVKWFISYPVSPRVLKSKGEIKMIKKEVATVFTQVIDKPRRKMIVRRGMKADEYFAYCEEVGCDVWGILCSIHEAVEEPMGLWLPKKLIPEGTSSYVQGVEVPMDYSGVIPEGFEIMELEPCKMMIFQGPSYDDADFEEEIVAVKEAIEKYDPTIYGYRWAYEDAPCFQYEPQGDRGYIEGRPVVER